MRRRALLALLATGVSGCVATPDGADQHPTTVTDTATAATTGTPATGDPSTTRTSSPTPGAPPVLGVPAAESDCPSAGADRIVCSSERASSETPMRLDASATSGTLPAAAFEFTLANGTDSVYHTNFYDWSLWKRVDGAWWKVLPWVVPEPLHRIAPGASHTWTLRVDNDRYGSDPLADTVAADAELRVAALGGGEYAFAVDGWFGSYDEGATVAFAVPFELAGAPLELRPTGDVTGTHRDGDTVVVETAPEADGDGPDALLVRRVEAASDARRLLPEHAVRDPRLRNTLPYFEPDVDAVRLLHPSTRHTWLFDGEGRFSFTYEDRGYEVRPTDA